MQTKSMKQCIDTIQNLGAIIFSYALRGKEVSYDAINGLLSEVNGDTKEALNLVLQAKNNNQKTVDLIPPDKSIEFLDIAEKYQMPGYTLGRMDREVKQVMSELNLAKAFADKDPQKISEAWQTHQTIIADHDSQGQVNGIFTANEMRESIIELYNTGLRPGLSTGWAEVNKYYTVRECEMTIVTGIPGSGKSTWLDALAVNLYTNHGWKIAFCSPENWPISRHVAGLIEKVINKPFNRDTQTAQRMTQDEAEYGIDLVSDAFYFAQLQDENMNINSILQTMQGVIEKNGVNGIVLDPWNELEHRRPTDKNETEFISESLGQIRRFARFNKVHIWIVAHPTKLKRKENGTYPVPRLYDISGSAAFYNKADNGISIHRLNPKEAKVDVHIQKIRFKEVGKLGKARLGFVQDTGTYFIIQQENEKKDQNEFSSLPF